MINLSTNNLTVKSFDSKSIGKLIVNFFFL